MEPIEKMLFQLIRRDSNGGGHAKTDKGNEQNIGYFKIEKIEGSI